MGASDVPDCDVAGHGKALVSGRTASGEHLTAREAQAWKQPHTSGSPSAAVTGVDRSPYRHGTDSAGHQATLHFSLTMLKRAWLAGRGAVRCCDLATHRAGLPMPIRY